MSATFNFLRINKLLRADENEPPDWGWLESSYEDPENFWQQSFHFHSSRLSMAAKSKPFEHYDFYHDMVVRHLEKDRPVLRWYHENAGWQNMTYDQLHARVIQQSYQWADKGVAQGQKICIILHFGEEYIVALATALKMGLVVSVLSPQGDLFLERRLKTLGPDHIYTEYMYHPILPEFEEIIIANKPSLGIEFDNSLYTYSSGQESFLLFSPLVKTLEVPRSLTSDKAYLHAMRDGFMAFSLNAGDYFAAPNFHSLQYQPCFLISSMLCGATYVHLTLEQIESQPKLINENPLKMMGVDPYVRDLLLNGYEGKITSWKQWFKNPIESLEWNAWQNFIDKMGLEEIPSGNIHCDAAGGGNILFSIRKKGEMNLLTFPSAGSKWRLSDVNMSGQDAMGDFGVFESDALDEDGKPIGGIILVNRGVEWMYAGSVDPKRHGRYFPSSEIHELVEPLPFVAHCSSVPVLKAPETLMYHFILLVFVGCKSQEEIDKSRGEWQKEIEGVISLRMGEEFFPDKIEFIPLYARETEDGEVDHKWCQTQYLTGNIYRKCQSEIFRQLTMLRSLAVMEK